jgi:uncharacterized protein YjbI with pentapeptide repeats
MNKNKNLTQVLTFGALLVSMPFSALAVSSTVSSPASAISVINGKGGISPEKKKKLMEEVTDGTLMRGGVVYSKHAPVPDIELARQFLTEGRPAASAAEMQELIKGLTTGERASLDNFRKFMDNYLMDSNKGPQLVNALNKAIDNPNAYKADPTFAKGVLREAFDKFISLDGGSRPNTDFSRVDMDGMMIAGLDLRKTGLKANKLNYFQDWSGTNASGLDIRGVNWQDKTVTGSIFAGSIMENADFTGKNISGTSFANAQLKNAKFNGTTTSSNTNFSGANARGANFSGMEAPNGNFAGTDLRRANMNGANLSGADFRGADSRGMVTNGQTNLSGSKWGTNGATCQV